MEAQKVCVYLYHVSLALQMYHAFLRLLSHFLLQIENLLADIGGQLGLWIGCSVMTFVELLEFITNLFAYLCGKRK